MDINDLTKTQLVLLGFLISFMTAIVTAIAVVSVMEQNSVPVTQTIYQVVKDTFSPAPDTVSPEIPVVANPLTSADVVAKYKNSIGLVYLDDTKTISKPLLSVLNGKYLSYISENTGIELKKEYVSMVNGIEQKIPATSNLERIVYFESTSKAVPGQAQTIVFDAPLPTAGDELYIIEGNPISFDRVYVKTVSTDDAYQHRIELTALPGMQSGALVVNKEGKALGVLLKTDTTGLVIYGPVLKKTFGF